MVLELMNADKYLQTKTPKTIFLAMLCAYNQALGQL